MIGYKYFIGLVVMGLLFSSACLYPRDYPGMKAYKEIARIPASDEVRRKDALETLKLDTQLDVYLFAQCCVEPSDATILMLLQKDGSAKVARIVERIQESNSESDRSNLIRLLLYIDDDCKCVASNGIIMRSLRASQVKITDDDNEVTQLHKSSFVNYLRKLEDRAVASPP